MVITAPSNYFLNSLLFAILILIMALNLDFKYKQQVSHLYLKLFLLISMPFVFNNMFSIFSVITLSELEVILFSTLFLFFYKKINEQDRLSLSQTDTSFFFFNFKAMTREDKIFNCSLILNAIIFLVLYYFLSYSVAIKLYKGAGFNFLDISLLKRISPFLENPILIVMVIFCFFRLYFVLFKKDIKHVFYDSVLFASAGFIAAYEILGIFDRRYFAPAIVIFIPVISFWLCNFYDSKKYFLVGTLCLLMAFLSFANIIETKVIFKKGYSDGYTTVYNILKIDRFSSSDHIIYIHVKMPFGYGLGYLIKTFEYVNGRFFETKYMDETENKSRKTWFVEDLITLDFADKNAIYFFPSDDLSEINKNFKEFIKIGKWHRIYIYVHKDRL
jgi:hypothetical protein